MALLPGVGADDVRVPVDVTQAPWRAVGRVQTELGARCTGFLVGPRTVMTAAHCLYRAGPARFVQPRSVHFLLGYRMGRYAAHARAVAFTVGPGWDPARKMQTLGADWAALTLDAPLGTADRVLGVARSAPVAGTPAMLGGYGKDRAELIDADLHCAVLGQGRDADGRPLITHACAGTSGTSGAPLLVKEDAGWVAAGIQVAVEEDRARGIAVPMP